MREERINIFMQSRAFSAACFAFALAMFFISMQLGGDAAAYSDGVLPLEGLRSFLQGSAGMAANFILFAVTTVFIVMVSRRFAFLGTITTLDAALFSLFQGAMPALAGQWTDGIWVALYVWICTGSLFKICDKPQATSEIFLIFAAVSLMTMFQSAFLILLPVFLVGAIQMRVITFKGFLAALFGVITPYWIGLGMGMISLGELHYPEMQSIFSLDTVPVWLYYGFGIAALGFVAVIANTFTLIKYRLQLRVYNGFTLVVLLASTIMLFVDSRNALAYIPLLNIVVATQVAHWFVAKNYKRKYIALTAVILAIIAIFWLRTFYLK